MVKKGVTKLYRALRLPPLEDVMTFEDFFKGWKNLSGTKRRGALRFKDVERLLFGISKSENTQDIKRLMTCYTFFGYFCLLRISEVIALEQGDVTLGVLSLSVTANCQKTHDFPVLVRYMLGSGVSELHPVTARLLADMFSQPCLMPARLFAKKELARIIKTIFPPTSKLFFTFHSLRHGRVADLYNSPAVSHMSHKARLCYIQPQGRWKSHGSVDFYLSSLKKLRGPNVDLTGLENLVGSLKGTR